MSGNGSILILGSTTGKPGDGKQLPIKVNSDGSLAVSVSAGASTIADGADVAEGAIADAAVAAGAAGTLSAKLRSISRDIGALLAQLPASLGIKTGAASLSVVPASDAVFDTIGHAATVSTSVTRPGDTNIYAANDAWANSTSAPTAGGFTLTGVARASGGSGIITDAVIVSSNDPATLLQGEIWLYDSAVATADNDNAAFTSSDADTLLLVGVIPFTLASTAGGSGTTSVAHVSGLNYGFTCVGSANLRYKIKVKNAYTPANAEVLTVRLKIVQTN